MAVAKHIDYFQNFTKTESQFKISFLNFFHVFLHHNTSWYIVVLGRRKNPTLFWASFGKSKFLTAAESAANASEQAKQALRQFLNCSLWFAGDKIISKDLPGCFAMQRMWIETPSQYFRRRLHHPKPEETHIRKQVCSSKNCTSLIIVFLFRTSKARQPLLGDTRAWDCGFFIREVSHIVQLLFSSFQTGSATIEELMLGGTRARRHHGQTADLHLGKYFNWTSGTCS